MPLPPSKQIARDSQSPPPGEDLLPWEDPQLPLRWEGPQSSLKRPEGTLAARIETAQNNLTAVREHYLDAVARIGFYEAQYGELLAELDAERATVTVQQDGDGVQASTAEMGDPSPIATDAVVQQRVCTATTAELILFPKPHMPPVVSQKSNTPVTTQPSAR